jgi:hypothetical protein
LVVLVAETTPELIIAVENAHRELRRYRLRGVATANAIPKLRCIS